MCVTFSDGSVGTPPETHQTIVDRIVNVGQGKKMKVYHIVEKGDILGVHVDLDQQLMTVTINGTRKIAIDNISKQRYYFCLALPKDQQFTILPCIKTSKEYASGVTKEEEMRHVRKQQGKEDNCTMSI